MSDFFFQTGFIIFVVVFIGMLFPRFLPLVLGAVVVTLFMHFLGKL